jgi:hypothetical protein
MAAMASLLTLGNVSAPFFPSFCLAHKVDVGGVFDVELSPDQFEAEYVPVLPV